jgi:alanyl-tRNA synthetase
LSLNKEDFEKAKSDHIEQSRTLSAGKFKSGLADNSEIITKYHTCTHLLHAALRQILGTHVQQSGSNITAERLRFDFSHPEKLTDDQIKSIEDLVNQKITQSLDVVCETMPFTQAQSNGALAFFGAKYPEIVTVFTIDSFSKEVCTGPHVKNTKELGKFKITKEESAGSGKRRIYAVLE